jgi:alanine or glycine:cation symporter, AGCS family
MKKNIIVSVLVLLFSVSQPLSSYAQEITCHQAPKIEEKDKTVTEKIDDVFGGVVGAMASVLFYEPFSFGVTDADGKPVFTKEPVLDTNSNELRQTMFFIYQADDKLVVENKGTACLDKKGKIQFNDAGLPLLTKWEIQDSNFIAGTAFVNATAKYAMKDGKHFTKQATMIRDGEYQKSEGVPLIVIVLLFGALFYTFWYKFVNIRLFKHAIDCIRGCFDNPNDPGEISHFQALTAALSATVGLGNIAGVAIAVGIGGPGAVFWMLLIGVCGMAAKFHECALGQMYRTIDENGVVYGGPKYYLSEGFKELGWPNLGKFLAFVFAIFVIGGSFGGGNMFQANQSYNAIKGVFPALEGFGWAFGFVMAFLVGLVIIGGIKRIGNVTEKLVPFMCGIYVLAALFIIFKHIDQLPHVISLIWSGAFTFNAGFGGLVGVMVIGIKRAVFSSEAGLGSASIAHAAAKTDEPVREGIVALLEPFIDTIVICSMTAFVCIITGAYNNPMAGEGVEMTRHAFGTVITWFPTVLSVCVFLFAFSTMISWSYYGEKGWCYLFGHSGAAVYSYRFVFCAFIVLGSITSLSNVVDFTDLMILSMAFPNILGGIWLSKIVKRKLKEYDTKLAAGTFVKYK